MSALVASFEVAALTLAEPTEWRADLERRVREGERVVTLFGRRDGDGVVLTAVSQLPDRTLRAARTKVDPARGYHALTPTIPALHCFERELHEQHAVRVAGHPWLKPIRFEGGAIEALDAYAFHKIEGKEVHEVAVGPIHAGVIEPGAFRFMCLGEQVHHLEIHLGYQHRGVEALLLRGDPRALAPLTETIAGDASIAHAWAYAAAIEALAGRDVDPAIDAPRAILLELERVAMHLAGLSGLAADVGFLQGATTYGRLRTTAINTTMRLCGSRFGRGAIRPGGLGAALAPRARGATGFDADALLANVALLEADAAIIDDCFYAARTVQHRLKGVGALTGDRALEIGLVGPSARACGVALDQRASMAGAYADVPIEVVTESSGDCWARARLRTREITASLAWIRAAVARAPEWSRRRSPLASLAPARLVVSMTESWRGEVVHCLETDEAGALLHYKVQDPSLRNWLGLALAVRDNEISDFPICNKSFDLSYCGNDL